jgi:hypothetical protein
MRFFIKIEVFMRKKSLFGGQNDHNGGSGEVPRDLAGIWGGPVGGVPPPKGGSGPLKMGVWGVKMAKNGGLGGSGGGGWGV